MQLYFLLNTLKVKDLQTLYLIIHKIVHRIFWHPLRILELSRIPEEFRNWILSTKLFENISSFTGFFGILWEFQSYLISLVEILQEFLKNSNIEFSALSKSFKNTLPHKLVHRILWPPGGLQFPNWLRSRFFLIACANARYPGFWKEVIKHSLRCNEDHNAHKSIT